MTIAAAMLAATFVRFARRARLLERSAFRRTIAVANWTASTAPGLLRLERAVAISIATTARRATASLGWNTER